MMWVYLMYSYYEAWCGLGGWIMVSSCSSVVFYFCFWFSHQHNSYRAVCFRKQCHLTAITLMFLTIPGRNSFAIWATCGWDWVSWAPNGVIPIKADFRDTFVLTKANIGIASYMIDKNKTCWIHRVAVTKWKAYDRSLEKEVFVFNVHFERTRSTLLISYSISIIRHAIIFPDYVAPTMTESES